MGPRRIGSVLRMTAATVLLAVNPCLAWAQGSAGAEPDVWCSKDDGCGRWGTLYRVTARAGRITIDYLDTDFSFDGVGFSFFEGRVDGPAHVEWTITGKIEGVGSLKGVATVEAGDALADLSKAGSVKMKGTLTRGASADSDAKTVATPFLGEVTLGKIVDGTIEVIGSVKGKIEGTEERIEGPFEGTLQGPIKEWAISGIYTPPPAKCSFAGGARKPWRREEAREIWRSNLTRLPGGQKSARTDLGEWRTEGQKKGKAERQRRSRAKSEPLEAKAESVVRIDRPLGKFSRRVKGTMSVSMNKITLQLPARPVLTDNCTVEEKVIPAGKLVLEKQ